MTLKNFIKLFVPNNLLSAYHLFLAHLADFIFGHPSGKLVVIGVTGTNGKSTTVNLIANCLQQAGHKVMVSSTINFKIAHEEKLNALKMTMPGRFFLQSMLARAVSQGCKFAIIESSSEGILQHRQIGIAYDVMVFTNLTPEHIEAHGGFENYKNAKLEYFRYLEKLPSKIIDGPLRSREGEASKKIPKIIVANEDDKYATEFLDFKVDRKITFKKNNTLVATEKGISFNYENSDFNLNLKGIFDYPNALAAISTARALGVDLQTCKIALEKIDNVPGRMELIDEGQNFKVLVDYAPEPEGLKQMYETVNKWQHGQIIHLLGSTGGGRDISRRKILGQIAAQNADVVIVTNEDPYNDEPQKIIDDVAAGAPNALKILDRRQAIKKALSLASAGDLVILTGKGAEQKMAIKDGYLDWDDRKVAREELKKITAATPS